MILQVVLSGLLAGGLIFLSLRTFDFRGLKYTLCIFAAAGIFFVWTPDTLTALANVLGIGRGADLIIYGLTLIVFLMTISMALQNRATNEKITALVRALAIQSARRPEQR